MKFSLNPIDKIVIIIVTLALLFLVFIHNSKSTQTWEDQESKQIENTDWIVDEQDNKGNDFHYIGVYNKDAEGSVSRLLTKQELIKYCTDQENKSDDIAIFKFTLQSIESESNTDFLEKCGGWL